MSEEARKILVKMLQRAVQKDASDLILKTGKPPYFRVDGDIDTQDMPALRAEDLDGIVASMLAEEQLRFFQKQGEIDLAFTEKGVGRFRVNIFRQRGSISIVMRRIKTKILNVDQLNLPPQVNRFADFKRGLALVTGTTGSGKSTALAAILDIINTNRKCHIVTIEDPIEFLHPDKKAVINQREIAIDTKDFSSALKSVMRQDPDVIMVGEMRDITTFQAAISASETGHLVFSTLHTSNAMQTIDRIIDLFPPDQHSQVRSQLSMNLMGILCLRLLLRADGTGRVPACEMVFTNASVRTLIRDNRIAQIPMAIQQGADEGMMSFNDSLHDLVKRGMIKEQAAMEMSENPEELKMMLQGIRLSSRRGGILAQ